MRGYNTLPQCLTDAYGVTDISGNQIFKCNDSPHSL